MLSLIPRMEENGCPRGREAGVALGALLFGVPLLAVGIWICVTMGLSPILSWSASQEWTATPCRITEISPEWNEGKTIATVTMRYAYRAGERSHEGTRYDFGNHRFDNEEFVTLVSAYPPESEATCYVDPDAPAESVLSREYNGKYTSGCIFGGVFLLLGLALTWVGIRWRSEPASLGSIMMGG